MDNDIKIKQLCLEAAKMCMTENGQGAFIAAWDNPESKNGACIGGDLTAVMLAICNLIDKFALQIHVPYKDVLANIKTVLRTVNKERKKNGNGEPLFTYSRVDVHGGDDDETIKH